MKRLDEVMEEIGGNSSTENMPTISSTDESASQECPLCGGLGYVREDVPVDHPDFGKLFPCKCKLSEIELQRMDQLRAVSNLDHMARMAFDTFVPEGYGLPPEKAANLHYAYDMARHYADNPQGWIILSGGYGSGKTHLAAAIANQVIAQGESVLFVVVPDLLDYLRATFGPNSSVSYDQRFDEVRNSPVLILDDLGTQSSTPWAQEKLFQILNHRYNARLPTVITSNHMLEEIDMRIRSRMVDPDLAILVTILAPDFRSSGAVQDGSDLSSLAFMQALTFESFDLRQEELTSEQADNLMRVVDACREFADQPSDWLLLTGDYGCGKTHLAAAIANTVVGMGQPALFVVTPDLLDYLRATFSPDSHVRFDKRFAEVRTAPLLVLDDLGTESASPWAQEKLFQLFNHRYNARLPTVITMSSDEFEKLNPRLRTRILDRQRCRRFVIKAPSYRGSPQRRASRKGSRA